MFKPRRLPSLPKAKVLIFLYVECSSFRSCDLRPKPSQFHEAPDYEKQEQKRKKENHRPPAILSAAAHDVQQERHKAHNSKTDCHHITGQVVVARGWNRSEHHHLPLHPAF
jgi:hypothetical protein